ncbi:DEAD/DEAH box helicase family protein [Corynebacterium appendicis]|uniref:DEAD/DEAH box helicase n=1 Tax=Corynebacterium appendicis TaxID=163202 RepID=UPI0021B08E8F|nr:DEAD/DEAH box helicase family protein [Corynebacterium appendicis]MCT1683815.1 DEAD/DEAH box helicase family protein [Corynebacterium appendicis]
MKYTLKPYQETASEQILARIDEANAARSIGQQASFALSAPTGAGKTVIATDVFERLLLPSDNREPDENAVIIWFSDNPDLNRQSRHRIEGASSLLASRTVEIDNSFVRTEFEAGKIYFLNTQKLSKGTLLTGGKRKNDSNFELFGAAPDAAQVTIWDTLRNTLNSSDHNVYFVVDEAHRGSGKQKGRETILQRLISGHTPEGASEPVPAMPVVMGISATPGKFKKMMHDMPGSRLVLEDVEVPTDEVQESGLLKDIVELQIPGEEGDAFENVFVRQAAGLLAESASRWSQYHVEQGGEGKRVVPLMVVQMQDLATPEDMYRVIQALRDGWPELPYDCFAHVFGEHTPITAGDTVIPYVEPQSVEDSEWIRVLFAKTAISTGWDCPRAEVMVSYRPANDEDYITQVIGRMVRSPLARRIPGDDLLNSVLCLLPKFNRVAAEHVVQGINAPDHDGTKKPPVRTVVEPETLLPIDNEDLWSLFTSLPTEVAPKRSEKPISRLLNVGIELEADGLLPDGQNKAEGELVSLVNGLLARFAEKVEKNKQDILRVETSRLAYRYSDRGLASEAKVELVADDKVIADAFEKATPTFTRALANLWVNDYLVGSRERGEDDDDSIVEARLTLAALSKVENVREWLWRDADLTAKQWLDDHRADIATLPDGRAESYTTLREMAEEPSFVYLAKPKNRLVSPGTWEDQAGKVDYFTRYAKRVLVGKDGQAPARLNDWETKVVETEVNRQGFEAWYRNPSRPGPDTLTAVYYDEAAGRWRSVQPDFVFFLRDSEGNMRASIVDPHGAYLGDALGKLRGLARYAEQYGEQFVRLESVSGANVESLKVLDLKSEAVRAAVDEATDAEALYEKYGHDYR